MVVITHMMVFWVFKLCMIIILKLIVSSTVWTMSNIDISVADS